MKTFTFAIHPYIIKKYNSLFDELIQEEQITQIEIDVLAFLSNNPEYNHAQDIVNRRGISKGHVSIAIEKLVSKHYVERQCDLTNRRCNTLKVTENAKDLVKKIQAIQRQFEAMAYQGVSQEEIEEYHYWLRRVYQNLGGGEDE